MAHEQELTAVPPAGGKGKRARRSDGSAGPPVLAGQNAALKETPKAGEGVRPDHPCAAHVRIVDADKALVAGDRKKIAICGFASTSRDLIPSDDPAWEIWGMNQLYRHIPRADRWFDLHWNWDRECVPGTDHPGWLRDCGIPVYMIARRPDLPTSVRYPIEEMIARGADYFTSSVALMLAIALWEIDRKVEAQLAAMVPVDGAAALRVAKELYGDYTIGLFGIDLVVGEEYFWQKPCAEFWIGAAAIGRGIRVEIPKPSALCKQRFRYGYETEPTNIGARPQEIAAHQAQVGKERDELLRRIYMLDGAHQTDAHWLELTELRLRGADIVLG